MTRRARVLRALVAGVVPLVIVVGSLLVGAALTPAEALRTLGTVTVTPGSGTVEDVLSLRTSSGCPAGATMSKSRITGPGFPVRGQNMSGVALGFTSTTKPFVVEAGFTLKDVAALVYPPVTYKGTYRVQVVCIDKSGAEVGVFSGTITFANLLQWKATAATTAVKPGPTTTLPSIKPSSSAAASATAKASATAAPSGSESAAAVADPSATDDPASSDPGTDDPGAVDGPADGSPVAAETSSTASSSFAPALAAAVVGGAVSVGAMTLFQRRRAPVGRREL